MNLCPLVRDNGVALYAQIAQLLRREIVTTCTPGTPLQPEGVLAQRFGINRHTLRHAIEELVALGLVDLPHGNYVTECLLDYRVGANTRFTENLSVLGLSTDCRAIRKQAVAASSGVARQLAIAMDEPVVWIETLRHADGRPVCPISHFLPMRDFSSLLGTCESGSLHEHLGSMFGCVLRRAESLVTAVLPKGEDAKLLAILRNRSARCCGKRASTSTRAAIVPSSMPSRAFAQTGFNDASISDRAFPTSHRRY